MSTAATLFNQGQYFTSARYAFSAMQQDPRYKPEAYSWITVGLARAGLYNAASYFFIRTLQEGDRGAIRRVLTRTEDLLVHVGGDLLRKYLIRHTKYEDYDSGNRSAYLYSLAKHAVLTGRVAKAAKYVGSMSEDSPLYPFALQIRGTAHAIAGHDSGALADFRRCAGIADQTLDVTDAVGEDGKVVSTKWAEQRKRQAEDLRGRCQAGVARTLYQMEKFHEADRQYDLIPKKSFVWTDILFEQAWNAFAKAEYNRTLGRLVSYKSPALSFVFNTEVDVLRAQAYLAMCLYADANDVINEFNSKYEKVGKRVKRFVERNSSDLGAFYKAGKQALAAPLHTSNEFYRMMNRFIRGPYFQNLVTAEKTARAELDVVARFGGTIRKGFPGFLREVLQWRRDAVASLGGAFVKNSLIDYHQVLISDFEKVAFIKLEMLSLAKDQLLERQSPVASRRRGSVEPERRDDQYRWGFNGEFWNDEIGDYVFGLESECGT